MFTHNERKVILVGKTGNGKSSLGNTLLGRNAFLASDDFDAVTRKCQLEVNIGDITVVDTPGLFDTRETNGNLETISLNALSILESLDDPSEPHAILFTLNGKTRFTDEELSVHDVLTIMFGTEWTNHAIVVLTRIKNKCPESKFESKWQNCKNLKQIVVKCNGRICRIDNKHVDADYVNIIRDNIDMVSQNGTRPFSIKYSDCRKNVLENWKNLEEYNGKPTHRIIRAIGESIKKSIEEKIQQEHIQEMKRIRYKKIKNAVIGSVVIAAVAGIVAPVKVVVAGVFIGSAIVFRYIWPHNDSG